ncbi:hypothetical protein GCM10020218_075830 [Dactylosporangium vinaceum]
MPALVEPVEPLAEAHHVLGRGQAQRETDLAHASPSVSHATDSGTIRLVPWVESVPPVGDQCAPATVNQRVRRVVVPSVATKR